ncbi:MAG: DMT family transporter [Cyanobacteria bacterium J069]|nr:MAG: DMT family transporter [Cyanobacteria bacterium J069]
MGAEKQSMGGWQGGKGAIALLASVACWGMSTSLSKGVLDYLPPLTLLTVQLLGSAGFLWGLLWAQGEARSQTVWNWQTLRFGLTGLLEPGLAYSLGIVGLTLTTASNASLISATEPVLIVLLSGVVLRERVPRSLLLWTGLAIAGVSLIVGIEGIAQGDRSIWGDGLILLGSAAAALYVVLTKRFMAALAPLPLAALQQSAGLLWAIALWSLWEMAGNATPMSQVEWGTWAIALLSGVINYAVPVWLYLLALNQMRASITAIFLTLIPVFGIGSAFLFLDERLGAMQWIGAAVIVAAVIRVGWGQSATAKDAAN